MQFNGYVFAADVVLIAHGLFLAFVLLGVVAIVVGGVRGWGWVRNPWFRFVHLGLILYVVFEAWLGIDCPLTAWESSLRKAAGQKGYGDLGFIAYHVHRMVFFPSLFNAPDWVFIVGYTAFGLLVAATLVFVPVRLRRGVTTGGTRSSIGRAEHR